MKTRWNNACKMPDTELGALFLKPSIYATPTFQMMYQNSQIKC